MKEGPKTDSEFAEKVTKEAWEQICPYCEGNCPNDPEHCCDEWSAGGFNDDKPVCPPSNPVDARKGVWATFSDEKIEQVKQSVSDLLEDDNEYNALMITMIGAQQLYRMARSRLEERLTEDKSGWEDGIEECMILSSRHASEQPFTRESLLEKMKGLMLAFVLTETQKGQAKIQQQVEDEIKEKREEHAKTTVRLRTEDSDEQVERGTVWVVAGGGGRPVRFVGEAAKYGASEHDVITWHLLETVKAQQLRQKSDPPQKVVKLGVNVWTTRATNSKKWMELASRVSANMIETRCDLLLVEDALNLSKPLLEGSCPVDTFLRGAKTLKRWAKDVNAVVVIAFTQPDDMELASFYDKLERAVGKLIDGVIYREGPCTEEH